MTPAKRQHLEELGEKGRARTRRDSVEALRFAWPHRGSLRADVVIRANVAMLRDLREWS